MSNRGVPGCVRTAAQAAVAGAMLAAGALLMIGVAQTAVAVPPDVGATFTNPQAQAALEAGLAALKEADAVESRGGQSKELPPALKDAYTRARTAFEEAAQSDPAMAEAWNGLGFSQRKLGDYDSALASYGRALTLKPGYPEATEYRGEAYLALNRVDDAKQAYLDLFATHRALAEHLLGAMKTWIAAQNSGANQASAADLARWVEERAKIAAQTASLTRDGAAVGWR